MVFDVDSVLAAQLKDAKFQFVAKPTAEGEQDATDDTDNTDDNTDDGNDDNTGGGQSGELEGG